MLFSWKKKRALTVRQRRKSDGSVCVFTLLWVLLSNRQLCVNVVRISAIMNSSPSSVTVSCVDLLYILLKVFLKFKLKDINNYDIFLSVDHPFLSH